MFKARPLAVINFNHGALEENAAFGHVEFLRGVGAEAFDDRLDFAAQHAVVRPGETGVAQVGGAAGEDLFVGGLHMGVGSDDGADAAVQHAGQGDLFRGGLGVHVNENDLGHLAQTFDLGACRRGTDFPAAA